MLDPKLFKTTPKSLKKFYEGHLGQGIQELTK